MNTKHDKNVDFCKISASIADHLLLRQIKHIKKNKNKSHFLHDFWRKIFLTLYSIN